MNNKGLTVVELVVTFALTSVIIFFLLQVIIIMKELYTNYGIKTELLTKQAVLTEKINTDFNTKKVLIADTCGEDCVSFVFNDLSIKQITFDRTAGTITYGDYTTKLKSGTTIGNVDISNTELTDIDDNTNNSILTIKIPIYNNLLDNQDFGINIIYQYDSRRSSIASIDITNYLEAPRKLYLFGSDNMIAYSSSTFEDPGFIIVSDDGTMTTYTTVDGSGHIVESDTNLEIDYSGLGSTVGVKYPIVYTIHNPESDYEVTRYVTKINQVNKYAYTGSNQTFTAPIKGIYKLELWGSSGASVSNNLGGHGGYTSGTISLN